MTWRHLGTPVLVLWAWLSVGQGPPPFGAEGPSGGRVTLQNPSLPLSQVLAELTRQTGIAVADRRQNREKDPRLNLDLNRATFWQALDAVARQANLRLSLYEKDGHLALREGPYLVCPLSSQGPFRVAVKRLDLIRDWETAGHFGTAHLEIAWEPTLQPLFFQTRPDALVVQGAPGQVLKVVDSSSGLESVAGRSAVEVPVRLEAPPRTTPGLTLLQGSFSLVGPTTMLTFTLDDLAAVKGGQPNLQKTQEGVTLKVRGLSTGPDGWIVSLVLTYPAEGPEFESFESWLANNEISLEKKGTRQRVSTTQYEIEEQVDHRAAITYYFNQSDLGRPGDWKLVYRTPGAIVRVPVRFEFKDLPLP
ncbi:MAG: hypothetical protein JO112_12460 [Planctomycetes bacterium]|nr:hypothetical protein [Planctomycetota bacterium]